jgi:hypothetical protein
MSTALTTIFASQFDWWLIPIQLDKKKRGEAPFNFWISNDY